MGIGPLALACKALVAVADFFPCPDFIVALRPTYRLHFFQVMPSTADNIGINLVKHWSYTVSGGSLGSWCLLVCIT